MKFHCQYTDAPLLGEPIYIMNEHSFCYEPWNQVSFTILFGTAGLDVLLDTRRIMQYSGYNPAVAWVRKALMPPIAKRGELYIECVDGFSSGTGTTYASNWQTTYDPESKWIFVGEDELPFTHAVEFATNTIACLRDGDLISVWVKPRFLKNGE